MPLMVVVCPRIRYLQVPGLTLQTAAGSLTLRSGNHLECLPLVLVDRNVRSSTNYHPCRVGEGRGWMGKGGLGMTHTLQLRPEWTLSGWLGWHLAHGSQAFRFLPKPVRTRCGLAFIGVCAAARQSQFRCVWNLDAVTPSQSKQSSKAETDAPPRQSQEPIG